MNAATLAKTGVTAGTSARIKTGDGAAVLVAALDPGLPDNCVRVAAAHADTANLGAMFGAISVEHA
jgi:NADH-quinone oxidoreductase subunit G